MPKRSKVRMSRIAGLIVMLVSIPALAETTRVNEASCATREILLTGIIEAEGAAPHPVSERLSAESITLHQARAACDDGRTGDALALYDQLINELAKARTPCTGLVCGK